MSFDTIPLPSVWDVPVAAGVPLLLGNSVTTGVSASASVIGVGILENWLMSNVSKTWGIFDSNNNKNVVSVSRVLTMDYTNSYTIPTAPRTNGSFSSYNKVKNPFVSRIGLVCDGTETGSDALVEQITSLLGGGASSDVYVRKSFIDTLESIVASTDLYSIVTPERTYLNANVISYSWRRASVQGISMLIAELTLVEVRTEGTLFYSSTRTSAGSQQVSNGTVQVQSAPLSTNSVISNLQSQAASSPAR